MELLKALQETKIRQTPGTPPEGSSKVATQYNIDGQDIELSEDGNVAFQKEQADSAKATLELLAKLGGGKINQEQGITYDGGTQIKLPLDPNAMPYDVASRVLAKAAEDQKELHTFRETFPFRPWDGAAAFERALVKVWGLAAHGKTTYSMFGVNRPYRVTVATGVNETITVPYGTLQFPMFGDAAVIEVGAAVDKRYGMISCIEITAPKRYSAAIAGLWKVVREELDERSIYKGKAFTGTDEPMFFDPFKIKREQVVYSEETERRLENSVWGPIRTADLQRAEGLPVNTKNLLAGPFGTGKTLALTLTAQEAVNANWTFIQARTTENLTAVIQTAVMYSPAVVAIEDIDLVAGVESDKKIAELLELFDGMGMKNNEVMVVMTSNHAHNLQKGMLRAGRIDALIEIGALDQAGVERLIKALIPAHKLDPATDYAAVYQAMSGYEPAFIKETFSSAQRAAVVRSGSRDYLLGTTDFENAALMLRPQHDMHRNAGMAPEQDPLERLFEKVVQKALDTELPKYEVRDYDNDKVGNLTKEK